LSGNNFSGCWPATLAASEWYAFSDLKSGGRRNGERRRREETGGVKEKERERMMRK